MSRVPPRSAVLWGLLACALGCPQPPPPEPGFHGRLGEVLPRATPEQQEDFKRGRAMARHRFTPAEGLGPLFNVVSCASCHERPVLGGSAGRHRNFLLVGWRLPGGLYAERGTNGVQVHYGPAPDSRWPTDPEVNAFATRGALPFFGLGLLAELPEDVILARADPDDRDRDGISGRPNFDTGRLGRFGRKAHASSVEGFIRSLIFNHTGITSTPLPPARREQLPMQPPARSGQWLAEGLGTVRQAQAAAPDAPTEDADGVADPELGEQQLFDLVSFVLLQAAPQPDEPLSAEAQEGQRLFKELGCESCHVPALEGPQGPVPAYTDLLLHDMGPELADGVPMRLATGSEYRTQPLWGVAAVGPWLHDGRADTLEQAIALHGGEALRSREAYRALAPEQRQQVVRFLESLGGREQRSEGLLPPGAPLPLPGAWGGPERALEPPEQERFLAGRHLFDKEFALGSGVGPLFNGGSCRACHFDPVIGGAGPLDVDVTHQGIADGTSVQAPAMGTLAHRHAVAATRPPVDERSNFFERRQTPPLFGLGLVERIPDSALLALEDPSDRDRNGVRGRVHRLEDGRVGRFGWKAEVPSLHEFVRDALGDELGLTVPAEPGRTFGVVADMDGVADPEARPEEVEGLLYYTRNLGPPPRTRTDVALEDRGEQLFVQVGCARCHVPTLRTEDGVEVALYSDLLLHDVVRGDRYGVGAGRASPREYRTAPLWGLARTGPYLHDGAAATVEQAIELHGGEALGARVAYERLSAEERQALLAFLRSL
jgi:CxxC motif-containing protein (DUF1111 family)